MCAGQAAKRRELVPCTGGQEALGIPNRNVRRDQSTDTVEHYDQRVRVHRELVDVMESRDLSRVGEVLDAHNLSPKTKGAPVPVS